MLCPGGLGALVRRQKFYATVLIARRAVGGLAGGSRVNLAPLPAGMVIYPILDEEKAALGLSVGSASVAFRGAAKSDRNWDPPRNTQR